MTDEEYRAFLSVLFRRFVQPRLPRVNRRHRHHMEDEWSYHLDCARQAARVLRFIETECHNDEEVYRTFTMERIESAVAGTVSTVQFANQVMDEAGFLDAYEPHAPEILAGLRPEHLPGLDAAIVRDMGSPDPEAELAELVYRARAWGARSDGRSNEAPVRSQLDQVVERLNRTRKQLEKPKSSNGPEEKPVVSRRWFKGLGQIGQGAALSIANVALAVGVIHFPVSPETQTWGAVASVATGIGTVLGGIGELRGE